MSSRSACDRHHDRLDRFETGDDLGPWRSEASHVAEPGYQLRKHMEQMDETPRMAHRWWLIPAIGLGAGIWLAIFLLINMVLSS